MSLGGGSIACCMVQILVQIIHIYPENLKLFLTEFDSFHLLLFLRSCIDYYIFYWFIIISIMVSLISKSASATSPLAEAKHKAAVVISLAVAVWVPWGWSVVWQTCSFRFREKTDGHGTSSNYSSFEKKTRTKREITCMSKQPRCKKDINILAFDGQCASAHLWWSICRSCNWKIRTSQKDAIFRKNTHKTNCLALPASSDCQKRQASFSDVWNCVDIFKQEKGPCCAYLHALNEQIKHISPAPCSAFWKFIPPSFGDANEILHHLTHQQNLVRFIYTGILGSRERTSDQCYPKNRRHKKHHQQTNQMLSGS